jgi:hypothetical protein
MPKKHREPSDAPPVEPRSAPVDSDSTTDRAARARRRAEVLSLLSRQRRRRRRHERTYRWPGTQSA